MSAQEIGEASGTSDATVVRTAKSLGYGTLRELRRALTVDDTEPDISARLAATIGAIGSGGELLGATAERHLEALEVMLRRVTPDRFERAVEVLAAADHLWWAGTGPSAYLAGYAAFLARRLGRRAGALTAGGTASADELLAVERGHAVVILAYGRVHDHVRVLLRRARRVGATTVLVTDALGARLPAPVDVRLDAGRGAPGLFASHGTTTVLLEALVLAVAASDAERSEEALADLNRLRRDLAGRPLDVDPT